MQRSEGNVVHRRPPLEVITLQRLDGIGCGEQGGGQRARVDDSAVGIITARSRTVSPLAELFIKCARQFAPKMPGAGASRALGAGVADKPLRRPIAPL